MRRLALVFARLVPAVAGAQTTSQPLAPFVPPLMPIVQPISTPTPATLRAADGTYLGELSNNPFDPNSVSNPFGKYGSPYSPDSVNNPYGKYGSKFSEQSATNPFASKAPTIVAPNGAALGQLSANPFLLDSTANPFSPAGSPFSPTSVTNPFSPFYVAPVKKQ
jgi:hypothetical protein